MSLDDRLNPDFIRENLLEIFNRNATDDENYTVDIDPDAFSGLAFTVKNNGRNCYELDMPVFENGKYVLKGGLNSKCSDHKGSGTKNINNIIKFGQRYGYDLFELHDASSLDFKFLPDRDIEISLSLFKFLTNGNTWYSQFGFENENTIGFKPYILHFINNTFSSLFSNISQVIDKKSKESYQDETKVKEAKSFIQRELQGFISSISMLPNLSESISIETNINDCFKILVEYLYIICPHNKCPEDQYHTIRMIKAFMYFIFFIIYFMIYDDPLTVSIIANNSNDYNKIFDFVDTILLNFKSLSLVLNPKPESMLFLDDIQQLSSGYIESMDEIHGGKSKKYQKSMKMKVTKRKGPRNKKRKTLVKKYKKSIKRKGSRK